MATTTTNFGWDIPQSTDLVKDGATAIATLGQDIDTSMVDLKGGTTGQILSKTSNTDMDFTWINNDQGDITGVTAGTGISGGGTSGTVTITNDMATTIDAKGDLIGGTGADTYARLAIGTNGQVLTADSTQTTGMKWATAASGASASYTLLNAGGTALTGAATITVSSISGYERFIVLVQGASSASAGSMIKLRINGDTTSGNYDSAGGYASANSSYSAGVFDNAGGTTNGCDLGLMSGSATSQIYAGIKIEGGTSTGNKSWQVTAGASAGGSNAQGLYWHTGIYKGTATISSISVFSATGNFDAGTLYVYGSAN